MKKKFVCKAGYIVFTILCFSLCGYLPDRAMLFFRIWYIVTIIVWCLLAINLLSLSLKYSRAKRSRRRARKRREKKE